MARLKWLILAGAVIAVATGRAQAAPVVTFYTDRSAFEAALSSSTTIDFEGIVAENAFSSLTPSRVVDGVTFSVSSGTLGVSGKNAAVDGSPYESALLFSNHSAPLLADLTSAGSGFTAAGGFFGDITSAGSSAILTVTGTTGVLDSRQLITADMGQGQPHNFFGWTVSGDTILNVRHNLNGNFEGIDDFTFGVARVADPMVPEPGSLALMGLGGIGLVGRAIRRRRKAAVA